MYLIIQIINFTKPSESKKFSPKRYNEALLRTTDLTREQKEQVMRKFKMYMFFTFSEFCLPPSEKKATSNAIF